MRKITYIRFQGTEAYLPGVGSLGNLLPNPSKTFKSLEMYDNGDKVLLKINGVEATIPFTNVQIAVYAKEEPKTVAASEEPKAE